MWTRYSLSPLILSVVHAIASLAYFARMVWIKDFSRNSFAICFMVMLIAGAWALLVWYVYSMENKERRARIIAALRNKPQED